MVISLSKNTTTCLSMPKYNTRAKITLNFEHSFFVLSKNFKVSI